jgi:decaprenylphospho-beta-D-ribofuranose 2-oxidase
MPLVRSSRFVSFDGRVRLDASHQRPDRYRHLEIDWGDRPRIARGGGYSYAAASFGKGVVVQEMTSFDRLLDHDGGCLVRIEAGATLLDLTSWARSRGLQVPALPGYPLITVGGCIAADVHGKNPARDGTFCDWVEALTIYTPSDGFRSISRSAGANLFATTWRGLRPDWLDRRCDPAARASCVA